MNTRAVIAAACLVVATAACSSGNGTNTSSKPTQSGPMTASELATKVGCSGYTTSSTEMYVKEGGDCTLNGQTISVDTFNDNAARDNYLKVAKSFGGVYGEGDKWVVHGDDSTTVGDAVKAAGGSMQ